MISSLRYKSYQSYINSNDFVETLTLPGIKHILGLVWEAYDCLINDSNIVIDKQSHENEITQELYTKILLLWRNSKLPIFFTRNIIPDKQYVDATMRKDKGEYPTIDICFRDPKKPQSYFGLECKKLLGIRKKNIQYYIDTGIGNYISGRYGSCSSQNAIAGYVMSGEIPKVVGRIINEIKKNSFISNLSLDKNSIHPQYISRHMRESDNNEILLYHLFFDFTA